MHLIRSLGMQSRPGAMLLPNDLIMQQTSSLVIVAVKELHWPCKSFGILLIALSLSVSLMEVKDVGVLEYIDL